MWDLECETNARRPDAVTLTDGLRRFTYTELTTAATRAALALRGAGIGPGDTVATRGRRSSPTHCASSSPPRAPRPTPGAGRPLVVTPCGSGVLEGRRPERLPRRWTGRSSRRQR
ncbi:AMP-binding protein [Streptomyces sp. NPDC059008]|uniref:AMP-binding protein n=1 Tax=Streptomyces sp. NPDC059008 TaxID=3346693 RepID=UPI0036762BCB